MNRRLVLTVLTGTLVVVGLGGSSFAATSATRSHKVCLDLNGNSQLLAPSYCVGWDDPIGLPAAQN